MGLKHLFHSAKADPADPTIIGATKWNADHYYVDGAGAPIGNVGAVLLAGAAGALTHLNSVAAGQVLTSAGAGVLPVWAAPSGGGSVPAALVADSLTFSIASPDVALSRPAAGRFLLGGVSLLQFGGTTSAFPALRRSGASVEFVNADQTAGTPLAAGSVIVDLQVGISGAYLRAGTGSPEGVQDLPAGSLYLRKDGAATTTLYIKTGSGATGWVAK